MALNRDKHYAYQEYLFNKEEWCCNPVKDEPTSSTTIKNEPFLIMELNRLVPYLDHKKHIKFHIFNMPHITIGKIEIVGMVMQVNATNGDYLEFVVEDGTGALNIFYRYKNYVTNLEKRKLIDDKYKSLASKMTNCNPINYEGLSLKFLKQRPGFVYPNNTPPECMAILEHKWWLETRRGLFGKTIEVLDHVHIHGYCSLDFKGIEKPKNDITFEHLSSNKLIFTAINVRFIDEVEYNDKLLCWIDSYVEKRHKPSFSIGSSTI